MPGSTFRFPHSRRACAALLPFASAALVVVALACSPPPVPAPVPSLARPSQRVEAPHAVVAAAHPLAAAAGLEMMRRGGNAVDAAVATAFALGVVEPMMAGLGGGGGAVVWLEKENRAEHLEFYPMAGADSGWMRDTSRSESAARRVAVPGAVAGLLELLERRGTLSREVVLAPAIGLARDGFPAHAFLARIVLEQKEKLLADSGAAALLYPGGRPLEPGERLVQPELARTLERIAAGGRDGFYRGPVAAEIVGALRAGGSAMTLEDLDRYRPQWRRPLCGAFGDYTVLSASPPLGGAEVVEALALLDRAGIARGGAPSSSAAALGAMVDALRIARVDRVRWIGDPDDAGVPAAGLVSPAFAAERAVLLGAPAPDTLRAGDPWEEDAAAPGIARCAALDPWPAATLPPPGVADGAGDDPGEESAGAHQTTHLSVVDGEGNAVALTYTIGVYFGSGRRVAGAFMNNAVDNFSRGDGANRRAPGRTPRSTISPTIVLDGDDARLVVGSPGGSYIPSAVVHAIVYTLALDADPATALAAPRVLPAPSSAEVQVEEGIAADALAALRARGYRPVPRPVTERGFGGVHMILVRPDGTRIGAADPRREGAAVGF